MKLRNKKTGKILNEVRSSMAYKDNIRLYDEISDEYYIYTSLAELNAEWEDYEEPKEYWFIDFNGEIKEFEVLGFEWQGWMKEIGNYFETREEAEKAVEKLKAWQRLKDKGFRVLHKKVIGEYINVSYILNYPATNIEEKDLNLLIGGKEC